MAKKVQLQTNGKEWQVIDGEQVLVDVEKQDIDPITSSSCVQIEGFRTLEEAVSDNKMLSQDLTYTKVMDKVGGDYHQNVLDGQYSKAILYGNTQVNLCEEDSSNALQIPTTFTSFNNGELQIKNKENQVVAPLIKGVTMVNLAQTTSSSITSGNGLPIHNVKGNTLYTLSFKFTTKNTNSGVVIQSYDANGTYLENTMHKTGLGDVVKFTFTTHANATKIHICNNAAYGGETIQLDDIMLIEGDQTALDIPYFKGMKSVELVRPLTNLFNNDTSIYAHNTTVTNSSGTVTVTSTAISQWASAIYYLDLKPNTKYVIMWDDLTFTQTASGIDYIISVCENDTIFSHMGNKFTTLRSIIFDTGDKSAINIRIHATLSNTEAATTTVTGLRVFEYDDYLRSIDLQSIGWFSGTKNVAVEPIKTCSKNLYPCGDISYTSHLTNVDVWFDAKGTSHMHGDVAQKSRARFLLKKGTYTITTGEWVNVSACQIVDDKEQIIVKLDSGKRNHTFTLLQDTYCTLRFKVTELEVWANIKNIQIERGETATDYVAHDSRYYEPDGQNAIVLRSLPNGVCDTFNLQTGEYTRRIGEAILDGSDNGIVYTYNGDASSGDVGVNTCRWFAQNNSEPIKNVSNEYVITNAICDKLKYSYMYRGEQEQDYEAFFISSTSNRIFFRTEKSKLNSLDVEGIKQYLQQNPITVQYELETPITTIIPRTIKRNNNGTVSTVDFQTYTNKENLRLPKNPTFLTINSMTSIKPVVEPITYIDFKTRLKANTDYTIKLNKETNAFVTTNLGGTSVVFNTGDTQKLVKTPSINLEQNLRISGSGSIQNIMVIEGDVLDKELPYFMGMCNVKMPIIKNIGKNLFYGEFELGTINSSNGGYGDSTDGIRGLEYIKITGGKTYVTVCDDSTYKFAYVCYDKNKTFLRTSGGYYSGQTYKPQTDVEYVIMRTPNGEGMNNIHVKLALYEYEEGMDTTLQDYKENSVYAVQGEIRLTPDMFEQGNFGSDASKTYEENKNNGANRYRTKSLIKVEPNTTYNIRYTEYDLAVFEYGKDEKKLTLGYNINKSTLTITTSNNCYYLAFSFVTSTLPTQYISIIKVSEIVQLRSLPNGVKDELNLLTGEYIQRVGEVVLDGSQTLYSERPTYPRYYIELFDMKKEQVYVNSMNCDKLNVTNNDSDLIGAEKTLISGHLDANNNYPNKNWLYFNVANIAEKDAMISYLQQNPITVQYELAEPIISYPRIVSNTQEREVGVKLPNGVCDTYNPSTGVTVKRVGKVVLDGSEKWYLDATKTNTQVFGLKTLDMKPSTKSNNLYCETMKVASGTDEEIIACDGQTIFLALLKTKASTLEQLKTYLASNPITVWYELKNPIVTTDIVLPNGVHDEYNPITGLYTKRIGLIEFDGSDDEKWKVRTITGADFTLSKIFETQAFNFKPGTICYSDSMQTFRYSVSFQDGVEGMKINSTGNFVYINILQSKLEAINSNAFNKHLSQNPIKVWYELATPITYQLTPYFGLPMPYAYQGGHLIMDSAYDGVSLPPEITYQLTVNRTGQITQNNIKLKEHTARLSNLEAILIEATLDSIFDREMQNFELELMNVELFNLDE